MDVIFISNETRCFPAPCAVRNFLNRNLYLKINFIKYYRFYYFLTNI